MIDSYSCFFPSRLKVTTCKMWYGDSWTSFSEGYTRLFPTKVCGVDSKSWFYGFNNDTTKDNYSFFCTLHSMEDIRVAVVSYTNHDLWFLLQMRMTFLRNKCWDRDETFTANQSYRRRLYYQLTSFRVQKVEKWTDLVERTLIMLIWSS